MKRITLLFILAAAAFAQQPNALSFAVTNPGPIRAGNTLQIAASISGSAAVTQSAFQFNIRSSVPGTWGIQPGAVVTAAGKTLTCTPDAPNNGLRCLAGGLNANTIADGVVAVLTFDIPVSATPGSVTILPSSLAGASGAGDSLALASAPATFTLAPPLSPCDINSDGIVDAQDVQLVLSQILGLSAPSVDLDNDGRTGPADFQRVVNAVNGGPCKISGK